MPHIRFRPLLLILLLITLLLAACEPSGKPTIQTPAIHPLAKLSL